MKKILDIIKSFSQFNLKDIMQPVVENINPKIILDEYNKRYNEAQSEEEIENLFVRLLLNIYYYEKDNDNLNSGYENFKLCGFDNAETLLFSLRPDNIIFTSNIVKKHSNFMEGTYFVYKNKFSHNGSKVISYQQGFLRNYL